VRKLVLTANATVVYFLERFQLSFETPVFPFDPCEAGIDVMGIPASTCSGKTSHD
jgi:hypothetical protein